jgi:two-component system sensor histidine kinase YesM
VKLKWFFDSTLRRQLLVLLILLVICAVSAIGIASIHIAQEVIRNHAARFGGKMLTQAAYRLGSVIDNVEITVDSLILDRRLAPQLRNLSSNKLSVRETAKSVLHDLLVQYRSSLPGAELIIIDSSGNMVTTYNSALNRKNLVLLPFPKQPKLWRLRYLPNYESSVVTTTGRLLELTARIVSLPGQSQSGWIILHMDYRMVESIMTNISLQENTLNRYRSDAIVFGPQKQIIFPWIAPFDPIFDKAYQKLSGQFRDTQTYEDKFNRHNYLIIIAPVPWTSWKVFISAPTSRLYNGLEQIYNSIFMIGLICILIAIFFASLISFFVTQPVNKLHKAMSLVEQGNFLVRVPDRGPLEIQSLGRAFNRMLSEVDILTKQLVAEESERKTAVIKVLQAQIAPHFLFNTLAAMAGMTTKRPPEEVAEALRSLKRLLYLSIGKTGDFISLAEEFEHIHHYLYLMNIRYPGKFSLRMELPEKLRSCRVIRLVLQPIIENCIQHGLKSQGGLILVQALQKGVIVKIRILDNGQGISREQLKALWIQDYSHSGVGVRNVNQRLKLSFGIRYGLTLVSSKGRGTLVTLRIPLQYITERSI